MMGYAGASERSIPGLTGVRQRVLISMLAALLALIHVDVTPNTTPNGAHGNSSSLAAIGRVRVDLECRGRGPATVAIVGAAAVATVIDDTVREQLARSVRLCTIELADATFVSRAEMTRLLASMLYDERIPAPYAIVSLASVSPAFDPSPVPFHELVAGFVLIDPSPPPATGLAVAADGRTWSLPVGDRDETALAILALFWPPDEG